MPEPETPLMNLEQALNKIKDIYLKDSNSNEVSKKVKDFINELKKPNQMDIIKKRAHLFQDSTIEEEPLLIPNKVHKYVIGLDDLEYPDIKEFYDQQVRSFWTPQEVDLVEDIKDWKALTDNERHFIKYVLCFFASSDSVVGENLNTRFLWDVENQLVKQFFMIQTGIEAIHQEMYNLLITTYIKDPKEQEDIFSSIETVPFISNKINWFIKWMNDENKTFHERLIAYAVVEGLLFSGSFCGIFWVKSNKQKMPGLCLSNEFISRDEGLHSQFSCLLYRKYLVNKLKYEVVDEIITSALEIEKQFICGSLPVELIGMNSDLMYQYLQFVADGLYYMLGYPKKYNVKNPFPFIDAITVPTKTNWFDARSSVYMKYDCKSTPFQIIEDF